MATFYSGNAPGDLLDVPNKNVETWLTDPMLIWIFMEIIPQIAAGIIVFMALTVIIIGITLLGKTLELMYQRKSRLKGKKTRFRVKRLKVPMDGHVVLPGISKDNKDKDAESAEKEKDETADDVAEEEEVDNAVGILTGTKRRKTHHHHRKPEDHIKHKKYFWVGKLLRKVYHIGPKLNQRSNKRRPTHTRFLDNPTVFTDDKNDSQIQSRL